MFISLDAITRSVLQQRQLPIHYYLQYLKHAADCFREFHYDTLRVINPVRLPVSPTGVVQLPCDYVDFVKIGVEVGQMVKPLYQSDAINRLDKLDTAGKPINYPDADGGGIIAGSNITQNDNGEFIGRIYGFSNKVLDDTYKVIPERNIIQINQSLGLTEIILEYISNGTQKNNFTKVDVLAQNAIECYMKWQASPSADNEYSAEAKKFTQACRKLRARKNPLTAADILRSYKSGIKTIR